MASTPALFDGHVVRPRLVLDVHDRKGDLLYDGDEPNRPVGFKPSTISQLHVAMGETLNAGGTAAPLGRNLTAWFKLPKGTKLGETPGLSPQMACKTGTHDGFCGSGWVAWSRTRTTGRSSS